MDIPGNIITWNINNTGFSAGINFSPWGIPLGVGISVSWADGLFMGIYGEVGYRIGGFGAAINYTYGVNYKYGQWAGSINGCIYGSFGPFTANISVSYARGRTQGGFNLGLGYGDGISGIGLSVGYGSNGFSYGVGGYMDNNRATAFCESIQDLCPEEVMSIPKTDAFLRVTRDKWYPDAPNNIVHFSYEKPSARAIKLFKNKPGRLAVTLYRIKGNGQLAKYVDIYFAEGAFKDLRTLYTTMGHEFVHACNYLTAAELGYTVQQINSSSFLELTEYWAYSFQGSNMNSFDIELLLRTYGNDFYLFNYQNMLWYKTREPL